MVCYRFHAISAQNCRLLTHGFDMAHLGVYPGNFPGLKLAIQQAFKQEPASHAEQSWGICKASEIKSADFAHLGVRVQDLCNLRTRER
jgi:hypothetical protein